MDEKKYYIVGDKKYAIPQDKQESFLSKFPDATEAKYYDNINGKKYYIPLDKVDAFESKFGLKKKEQTQPQEEVSTSVSQTPVQPSTESGASVEPQPIAQVQGGEITDLVEPYKVNDSAVTRDDLLNALKDEQFVESIRTGQTRLEIQDDQDLQDYASSVIQPPSEKKIDETLNRKSEGDDSVLDILGRSFQSGVTKLAADLYRTPEFIYDIAVDGYNQLLELQNKILPESLEARKIATSEELSEMTGIDNKYAENLEAYAQKKREINEKYQKPIFDNIKEGNYSEAALSTAMSVTESLPFMLSMMIPSAAGVKAASMFGGTTAVMGAGRKQELLEGDKELSETQMNTNALLYGMAEATDVLFGSGAVGRAIGDVVKKEGINKGKDFAADVVKNLVKERAYLVPFTEGLQESFTTYTQNVSDRITGVDTEKPLTEGVADAFIVGATMGAGSATVLQGAKYLSGKMKGKQSISNLNNITKNPEVFNEVTGQIDALVNTGELTEEEANALKEDITNDVQVNASIPENIEGEDRAKAIELQKKYTETKINQEKASEPFKELYKPELESLSQQLQELATKKQQTTKGDITQEQFDKALEIIEPVASQRGELTLEQLDEVMSALGENASDVIDISQKKDAVDLYNELTDKKQEYAKKQQGGQVRQQGSPQKGKSTSNQNMPKGNGTVVQDGKKKSKPLTQETQGLTEKEQAKQGVEEIVQAYKNKLKEAVKKANEKISEKVKEQKQKTQALRDNIKSAKEILTGIIEDSIPKGVSLGKSILKDIAKAKTPKQIQRVADRIERNVENIQRRNKINDIKSKQAKVKKKLPNFTNQQESIKEILNVDLSQVKDLETLQEIENELDAALERDVAKLDPKRMSELLDKLEQKTQPEQRTTSKRKVSEKIQSLNESDKTADKKIKELQALNRALDKTLGLNQINQDDYNDALSMIEKELESLEKDRQEDTKQLNKDSVERLGKLDEKPFSKVQKDEIKRLKDVAGKSTKYRDALKLNEIIDELELGYIPVKQMDEYRNDAISYQESNNLSTQINKRTGLDSVKNKLASLFGLKREGTLRGSKTNKSFSDALNLLELNTISSWNDLFGLGKSEGISRFLNPLFTNMIASTSRDVRNIMNNYFAIKYPISPFKKGLSKDKEIGLIMMRKQGDWAVTEGMDTDYWGELLSDKNIEEAKRQYNGDKSDISLKKLKKIYDSLPKRNGKLDYEGYFENLKGAEKRMNDFLTKLAEDNAPLQEIANQRAGKEFVKRDSRYYLTDIVLRDSGGTLEDGLGGLSFILSNGVSLEAGVGETRTAGKKVKPILLDLDRIVSKQTTETIRDYNLSSNLKAIRKTFKRTIPKLTEPNAKALMSMFGQALDIRMQAEYGIRPADSSRNFIGKLLGAARAYFLAGFKRVGVEFVAEVVRSLPATRKRYVPKAIKAIVQSRARGVKLHKELLERTSSPYLKKAYLESSAADSQVTADTKRTILGRFADFVKGTSDGMMGVSSNVVFPQVWLPEFLYQFKQLTGKDFDVKNYSDSYFNKNEKAIRDAAIIADTNAERIFGGSTRAARRTKAKWLGTPVIGLIQSIQGKFTGDYSFGNKYKYVDPYTNLGMLNTFLSNFAGIEAYNTFTRGVKGLLYGENVSRGKAGQFLLFGIMSGTLYTYLRDEIMTILFGKGKDDEDDRDAEDKFIDAMISNIIFLSVGQYGQSAQLALRTFVGIYEDRLDDEQKKRFRKLSQDRFNVYPLNFGYGSITRAYDNLIPFLGETISTISQSKDVLMNIEEVEGGITLSEEEMKTLKAAELVNNMMKLAFIVKGTQIPMQKDVDRVLKALDKIESGKEITRSEYELLETYNFIPIIDEIYENADIKED